MDSRPVGVGIVGTGLSASQHLRGLKDTPNGRVVAVSGTTLAKARAFAEQWGIPKAYGSAQELIADPEVEAVHTCTPPDLRVPLARACAMADKHVLLEKPMARTIAEADQIITACDAAMVKLAVMFQNRFTPLARKVKAAVDEGKIGKLALVTLSVKWHRTETYYRDSGWRGTAEREGGAVLINQAIHSIDLLRWIAGPVTRVEGLAATTTHPIEMEDVGLALLRFANGAVGSIVATTVAYPGFPDRLELHGSLGSVVLAQGEGRIEWHLVGSEPREEALTSHMGRGFSDPAATSSAGHSAQFTDFYAAIRQDREPFVDGREGRNALEVVEAIYRASRSGSSVVLPL